MSTKQDGIADADTPAVAREVMLEVQIDAPRERVWEALVEETDAWWHRDFRTGPEDFVFRIQARLGGWAYEDWGDGDGQIWGVVQGVRAGEMLQVAGDTDAEWGGPHRGLLTWRLSDDGGGTRLRFRHALHGRVSAETASSLGDGWRLLLADGLKPFAEGARTGEH